MADREVIVKYLHSGGEITWIEELVINEQNKITLHHGFSCIVDEGAKGADFKKVFNNVSKVVFTGRMYKNMEVVEVHSNHPFCKGDETYEDFEKCELN